MENIKFIGAQNEIQKIYSDLGLIVPVGDLDNGKAPAIQPLPATSTTTSITAKFNVMSGAEISSLSYKVNDGEATSITPAKGVVTITLSDLEYNSGPYEIELTATNEIGSTVTSSTVALQHYTNWATPDEVLLGNKYIGEDGQEHTGEYEVPVPVLETVSVTPTTSAQTITPSTGYDGISQVNVSAVTSSIDANITAGNIKKDVTILGVTGTFEGGTPQLLTNMVTNPSEGWTLGEHDLDGFTTIGDYAFNAANITNSSITIQEGVTSIGDRAFGGVCASFTLPSSLREIGSETFTDGGDGALVIPNGVTSIGDYCFGNSFFTSVTIPSSVTSLGSQLFAYCQYLTTLVINANITSLGSEFANECGSLTSVTLPSTLERFANFSESGVFNNCSSLPSITIPASVTDIATNNVFTKCDALREIHFLGNMPNTYNSDAGEQKMPFGDYTEWHDNGNDDQRPCGAQYDEQTQQWILSGTLYVPTGDSTWDNAASDPAFATLLSNGWTLVRE